MERVIEFPHAHMDRRPRKRPRLGWDVAPQALKIRGRSVSVFLGGDAKLLELEKLVLPIYLSVYLRDCSNPSDLNRSRAQETQNVSPFLQDANEESKSVTKASSMKAIKKRMEKDVDEVGKIARNVKAKLEAISKDNLANRQKPRCGKGTGVDRSRTNMTNALTKKFRDLMIEFQTLRQRIQDEYREVVERRVITVTGTRPDEETIDHLIETGNSEQILHKAIQEMGRGQYYLFYFYHISHTTCVSGCEQVS
ncbi:hypothetical protein HYC85_013434 [Camellia sinensis]|uniref:Syntaxin N-terminal domain-containing protein n=1 Tax=Camellia sinensis TaxID=4442 RepID=A0A7J7H4K8_CAMSI|nr:hypothetical protein HYC85_013434 [Camellia sinensis]